MPRYSKVSSLIADAGRKALVFGFVGLAAASPAGAQAPSLEVTLEGLRSTKGKIFVCIWKDGQTDFPRCINAAKPVARQLAPANAPTVTFTGVTPGTYAVTAMHDETGTGDGEFNLVGLPKSGVALSNNAILGMTNRPTFEKGKFEFPATNTMKLETQYLF